MHLSSGVGMCRFKVVQQHILSPSESAGLDGINNWRGKYVTGGRSAHSAQVKSESKLCVNCNAVKNITNNK